MTSRNPFRVRTSEYLEDNREFLSLFGLNALEIFDLDDMWVRIQTIRSARGSGKTSVMRIFSPSSLNMIQEHRDTEQFKLLYARLKKFDAFSDKGVKVLGVTLSLFGDYQILSQLDFKKRKQSALFFLLLTSRIIIATLRSVCELKEIEFPKDLNKIHIKHPGEPNIPNTIPIPCNGKKLFEWASSAEQNVSNLIESNSGDDKYFGYETLSSLHIIRSENLFYDGKPVAERTLLMLDNVDKLTLKQKNMLLDVLVTIRVPIGIWLAERLEALSQKDILSSEGTSEREYAKPIMLEKFWRRRPQKFERLLTEISDKRAEQNRSYNILSFSEHLSDNLGSSYDEKFQNIIHAMSKKLDTKHGARPKYSNWFAMCKKPAETYSEAAKDWKLLEIAIERNDRKTQKTLFEDAILVDNFRDRLGSKENHVAEYYIRTKYGVPYYFGFQKLASLASSNIQQFLYLSSDLFDEMIIAKRGFDNIHISPARQEEILRKAVDRRWTDIIQSVPDSLKVVAFLDTMAKFCYYETNRPNSPYSSVTGLAISSKDLERLRSIDVLKANPKYKPLARVLSICFAHNLLEPLPDSKQGSSGATHLLIYLNRLLCFKYKLPLPYGGWREQSLDTLSAFVEGTNPLKRKSRVGSNKRTNPLKRKSRVGSSERTTTLENA